MPTDPTPLAQRLVHAAATAILPAYSTATKRKARLAVSAALRELAMALQDEVDACAIKPPDACSRCRGKQFQIEEHRTLADSIEKGGDR